MSQSPLLKPEIQSGTIIDSRYIIQKLLGQGGLGRTYLAFDTRRFNEPCVLKEFAPIGTGKNELERCRNLFKREAKILHQLEHSQIPRFLACFEGDGRLFLVQEFVDGKTYSALLAERQTEGRTFVESEVIQWLKDLLPVLQYVHRHHIIHRDISPDNIMLPTGKILPVLIDFGVGKQIADIKEIGNSTQATFVGKMSLVGKVGYAPREQISLGICSPSSDIYALGVTAIVLLTGKDPSLLMDQYTLEWKWCFYADVSPGFAQILNKMLADVPKNRYQTSEEVLADLEPFAVHSRIAPQVENQNKQGVPIPDTNVDNLASDRFSTIISPGENTPEYQAAPTVVEQNQEYQLPATNFDNWQELQEVNQNNNEEMEEPQSWAQSATVESSANQFISNPPAEFTEPPSSFQKSPETVFSSPVAPVNYQNTSSQNLPNSAISQRFINRCQEELAYYIGPMASMIIEDTLIENPQASPYQFVEILAKEIPESQSAVEFTRKLLS